MLDDLTITHVEVHNAAIHSDMRLNYEQVDQFIGSPNEFREKWGEPICDLLTGMHELAMQMRKARFKQGALSMDMPDIKLDTRQIRQGQRCLPSPSHGKPSDHRRVHARRQPGGRDLVG